jgi:hypothetical protein
VKNGKGFWAYQFRDGNVIRSKGLGSAARVTPALAHGERIANMAADDIERTRIIGIFGWHFSQLV